jgi:hypothetical protein
LSSYFGTDYANPHEKEKTAKGGDAYGSIGKRGNGRERDREMRINGRKR